MTIAYGNLGSSYWRAYVDYTVSSTATTTTVTYKHGIYLAKELHSSHGYYTGYDTSYITFNGTKRTASPTRDLNEDNTNKGNYIQYASGSFSVARGTSAKSLTLYVYNRHEKTYSGYVATSTISVTISIPALAKYTMTFNANGGSGAPSAISHYYGKSATIPATKPTRGGYAFQKWNTATNGSGTSYYPSGTWSGNANVTVYAIWGVTNPPSFSGTLTCKANNTNCTSLYRGISKLYITIPTPTLYTGRSIASSGVVITVRNSSTKAVLNTVTRSSVGSDILIYSPPTSASGSVEVVVSIKDNAGAVTEKVIGTRNIVAPSWKTTVTVQGSLPRIDQNGNAILDSIKVFNYTTNSWAYLSATNIKPKNVTSTTWDFDYTFSDNYVSSKTAVSPTVQVDVGYRHFTEYIGDDRRAFFTTSRNQNYSNGIYNQVFVSGCNNEIYPQYTSRVWWSKINDPLYFPDTNYIEVGSNDTAVQGLTKVGDYLGVVKQSKTTDTAIYLLYPTSFEEETTFAVKQGVQGVGALARYSFNILGDETLFLSPHGVMAIVPTQDEEHKVQNRSYFVDGKMLKESELANSYSFVHDGKYYLSIGNGSVYVLDGNQRNSWGNDKTNLVYECYYLENVPANCFVKYNDNLAFSTSSEVCIVGTGYTDAYRIKDEEEKKVPVVAKWSTVFDDDGALHYYKTMQKKGNLVSVLPLENQTPYVESSVSEEEFYEDPTMYFVKEEGKYIRCNDGDEYITVFEQAEVDEEIFNAEKTMYYYMADEEYVQCTDDSVYDPDTIYYVRVAHYYVENRNATKVFIRKDDKEPVEIKRTFGLSSEIPSELFINKKFKKYKRLQFILINDSDEDFGVDEIVKNYTVGNYAKR